MNPRTEKPHTEQLTEWADHMVDNGIVVTTTRDVMMAKYRIELVLDAEVHGQISLTRHAIQSLEGLLTFCKNNL